MPEDSGLNGVSADRLVKIHPGDTVAEAARRMRDHEIGSLLVVDEKGDLLGILTERDVIGRCTAASAHPEHMHVADAMTRDVVTVSPGTPAGEVGRIMNTHRIRHLPVAAEGRPLGLISTRDILARQVRLNQAYRAAAEQVALLSKGLRHLHLDELLGILSTDVPRLFGADRWALCLAPEAGEQELIRREGCPCDRETLCERQASAERSLSSGGIVGAVPHACGQLGAAGSRALLPLGVAELGEGCSGLAGLNRSYLCMCGLEEAGGDDAEVLRYKLGLIREVATVHLINARLHRVAEHDGLTDLKARRALEEALAEEYARSLRHRRPFSVAILDVDRFKEVNDSHGHAAGDGILVRLAEVLRRGIRTYDLVARYGGDEFVVLLPETDRTAAEAVVERIMRLVRLELAAPDGTPVTISCGLAEWTGSESDTGAAVLRRADAALYEAKGAGRNRLVTAA